jgi:tetratricopeptide (TPR) repeat protein
LEVPVVLIEMRQKLKTLTGVLVLAAVMSHRGVFSQPVFDFSATDAQQRLVERIEQVELEDGLNSAGLIEPLTELGLLYQESGEHILAVAASQRAIDVVRVNLGLYALEQAPLLRQLIASAEAIGAMETAWDLEQALLTLAGRHPNDLRAVPIYRETAGRRMDVLERYFAGEFAPEVVVGCYYRRGGSRSCTSGSKGYAMNGILADAQANYAAAIEVLLRNELYSSDELRELEMEIVRGTYLYGDPFSVEEGLRRILSYEERSAAPALRRINILVLLADNELRLSKGINAYESVLDLYKDAYRQLREADTSQAAIDEIFSPRTPVVLPAFLPHPLVSVAPSEPASYVDVAFRVTTRGKSDDIEILSATPEVTRAAKRNLTLLIMRSLFRPRVTNGQFVDSDPIVVRYYVDE